MEIEVKILDDRLTGWGFPAWGSDGAAGLDLHACLDEPLVLAPGSAATLVSSGLAVRIGQAGWCGLVVPRSGLGHRGLVLGNAVGVIDADYEGAVFVSAWNRTSGADAREIAIAPGERIAQMLFVPVARPTFVPVSEFGARSKRGSGGFGSTGRGIAGSDRTSSRVSFLSRRSLFAVVAVVDVALHARPGPVAAKALAGRHRLGPRNLEPVLQALVRAGILKGVRGPRGGYQLARERRRVSVGDVVRATARVADPDSAAPDSELIAAVIDPALADASEHFLAALDGISIETLCARAAHLGGVANPVDFTI